METEPRVEARPPALIESAVGLIIPPAAREHVLGDLAERYASPERYVLEAARTFPVVLASQIRRTSRFVLWPMIALILASGFGAGAGAGSWVRGVIPALATLIGFMLRDAYRVPDLDHPWRQGVVDVTIAAGTVLASQMIVAAVRPGWLIEREGIIGGSLVLAVLYLLRMQRGPGTRLLPAPPASEMTIDELRGEIAVYDRHMRRAARIEIITGWVMVPIFAASVVFATSPLVRIGAGLTVAGVLFVIWTMRRGLLTTAATPNDVDFTATAARYRTRLASHQRALRTIWLWYLLPLTIGPAMVIAAGVPAAPQPTVAAAGTVFAFTLIWLSAIGLAVQNGRALRRRMLAIEQLEEQR